MQNTSNRLFDENPNLPYLDKGYVVLLDYMGSDEDIEYAARMSYAEGTRTVNDTKNLINYLWRHHHTSPFEMAEFKFQIKLPIQVMRQLVRHRTASLNEMSLRYSILPENEMYVVPSSRVNTQSSNNKQCSSTDVAEGSELLADLMAACNEKSYALYSDMVEEYGVSREVARGVLPVNSYTEVVWKIDLKNLLHFIRLRLDAHAQVEIRELAQAMYDLIQSTDDFEYTLEAFEKYTLNAKTFSGPEMEIIEQLLLAPSEVLSAKDFGLSKREYTEFLSKFKESSIITDLIGQ